MAGDDPTVMKCESGARSLQPWNTNWVPAPSCKVAGAEIVCTPSGRLNVKGANCAGPPSTLTPSPLGMVVNVIGVRGFTMKLCVTDVAAA